MPACLPALQAEVFEQFLAGSTLSECYAAVAAVANRWLDMLDTQARGSWGLRGPPQCCAPPKTALVFRTSRTRG